MKNKIKNIIYLTIFFILVIFLNFYLLNKNENENKNENKNKSIIFDKQNEYIFNNFSNKYSMKNKLKIYQPFENYSDDITNILDLRNKCPKIYDQGSIGTCHVQSICFLYHYICKQLNIDFIPSRMFLEYTSHKFFNNIKHLKYNEQIKNFIFQNAGGDSIKDLFSLFIDGICDEKDYPYPNNELLEKQSNKIKHINELYKKLNNSNYEDLIPQIVNSYNEIHLKIPNKLLFKKAKQHRILNIIQIDYNLNDIKKCLNYVGPISFSIRNASNLMSSPNIYFNNPALKKQITNIKFLISISNDSSINKQLNDILNGLNQIKNNIKIKNYKLLNKINDNLKNQIDKLNKNNKFTELTKNNKFKEKIYYSEEDLTLEYPTELIKDCVKIFKKYNIDLNELIKIKEFQESYNLNINMKDAGIDLKKNNLLQYDDFKYASGFLNYFDENNDGHMMSIVGYNDDKKYFIIRNSWGEYWGDNGYFYIDYEYFINENILFGCKIKELFAITNTTDGSISFINN